MTNTLPPTLIADNDVLAARSLAQDLRALHEHLVATTLNTEDVGGTCLYAAFLLQLSLQKFTALDAVVRGGSGERGEGYCDQNGVWRGHYWVEAVDKTGCTWIVDLTSDQFGGPTVYFSKKSDSSQYLAGPQEEIEEHLREFGPEVP